MRAHQAWILVLSGWLAGTAAPVSAWKDGRRNHLFVLPAAGGDPVDVTAGMSSKPFGGAEEFTNTPGVLRPNNSIQWHETVPSWLARWVGSND